MTPGRASIRGVNPRTTLATVTAALATLAGGALIPPSSAGAATTPDARTALTSRAYFNNPYAAGHNNVRDLVVARLGSTPKGATVRVSMFNINDSAVLTALRRAHGRGVNVKVIVAKQRCSNIAGLRSALGANRSKASFAVCATGSRQSNASGHNHMKVVTFSKTAGTPYVTLVGSANLTVEGYADQWVDMFQYANRKDVYTIHNKVFNAQRVSAADRTPYVSWTDRRQLAHASFMPANISLSTRLDGKVKGKDPVLKRLREIPATSSTSIVVANYAMWGKRGTWITQRLIRMKRKGAHIRFISGPPTADGLENKMRKNGIPVTRAFDRACTKSHVEGTSCNYIHLKAMVASFVRNGKRTYRTWTGSDNWATGSLRNDENIMRIGGPRIYKSYLAFFRSIEKRY